MSSCPCKSKIPKESKYVDTTSPFDITDVKYREPYLIYNQGNSDVLCVQKDRNRWTNSPRTVIQSRSGAANQGGIVRPCDNDKIIQFFFVKKNDPNSRGSVCLGDDVMIFLAEQSAYFLSYIPMISHDLVSDSQQKRKNNFTLKAITSAEGTPTTFTLRGVRSDSTDPIRTNDRFIMEIQAMVPQDQAVKGYPYFDDTVQIEGTELNQPGYRKMYLAGFQNPTEFFAGPSIYVVDELSKFDDDQLSFAALTVDQDSDFVPTQFVDFTLSPIPSKPRIPGYDLSPGLNVPGDPEGYDDDPEHAYDKNYIPPPSQPLTMMPESGYQPPKINVVIPKEKTPKGWRYLGENSVKWFILLVTSGVAVTILGLLLAIFIEEVVLSKKIKYKPQQ